MVLKRTSRGSNADIPPSIEIEVPVYLEKGHAIQESDMELANRTLNWARARYDEYFVGLRIQSMSCSKAVDSNGIEYESYNMVITRINGDGVLPWDESQVQFLQSYNFVTPIEKLLKDEGERMTEVPDG